MLNKKIIFLAILLIGLLSLSAVSAAEDLTSDIASINDDAVIEESINDVSNVEPTLEESGENVLTDDDKPIIGALERGSFTTLYDDINNGQDVVNLTYDYDCLDGENEIDGIKNGILINRPVTIYGNNHTIDARNQVRFFRIDSDYVVFHDINFINAAANSPYSKGGICNLHDEEFTVINCTFTGNNGYYGAAIFNGTAINCTFTGNNATVGGAAYASTAINCRFIQNTAELNGGAMRDSTAINCTFIQNSAKDVAGAMCRGNAIGCTFIENSAPSASAMIRGTAIFCIFENNDCSETDIVPINIIAKDATTTYGSSGKLLFDIIANDEKYDGYNTTIDLYKDGKLYGSYSSISGDGGWTFNLPIGTYKAVLSLDKYSGVNNGTATITVSPIPTKIAASAVTATYNVNKNLTITLTDGKGKALSGANVTVTIGSTTKIYKTDKNGKIKINVAKNVPKTYTAKIKYAGNAYYAAVSKSVKVVVKKATPKMTAKAKAFKVGLKTKKYTVTLKNNKGAVMKKVKLTLKVNKKTFKATTNSKGQAIFKITNLKKKDKYTAVIKFAGSKYYKALSKKAVITAK